MISFSSLIQQSFNFLRNNIIFAIVAILAFIGLQFANYTLINQINLPTEAKMQFGQVTNSMLFAAISLIINITMILAIVEINKGSKFNTLSLIIRFFSVILPVIALNFVMVFPLVLSLVLAQIPAMQVGLNSYLMLPLLMLGVFIFIKLNVITFAYLHHYPNKNALSTLKDTWNLSNGRMLTLIKYVLLVYIIPGLINTFAVSISPYLMIVVSAFLNVLVSILGFRFYQVYSENKKSNESIN